MFLRKVAKLIHDAPEEMGHLVPLLREAILREAKIFSTPEALKTYLREHPDADKSKHTVRKVKHKDQKDAVDFGEQLNKAMDGFDLEPFEKKTIQKILNDPREAKELGQMAKKRLSVAEREMDEIEDPKIKAGVKKEFESARKRTNKTLTNLEEALSKKMEDPKQARAVRDYMESTIMFNYVRSEVGRDKKNKKRDQAKKNFTKKPKTED